MRVGAVPESLTERIALALSRAPLPLIDSYFSFMLARTLMVATKSGVFDALATAPADAAALAQKLGLNPLAMEKLLRALAGAGYVEATQGVYALTAVARRWLPADAKTSYRDKMLFQFLEWDWWGHCEEYLASGKPLRIHETLSDEQWALYQRGMRAGKDNTTREVAKRLPIAPHATSMLDIGGSHGAYSAAICRRHPSLQSTILELPQAIRHSAPLLAREQLGDRVRHREGDALTLDLGEGAYDVVFMASLVHHFDEATNRALLARIARALRPGGIVAVMEMVRVSETAAVSQFGGLMDLYFAMTSQSGTWTTSEMASWQTDAGLTPLRAIRLKNAPGVAVQCARKS